MSAGQPTSVSSIKAEVTPRGRFGVGEGMGMAFRNISSGQRDDGPKRHRDGQAKQQAFVEIAHRISLQVGSGRAKPFHINRRFPLLR